MDKSEKSKNLLVTSGVWVVNLSRGCGSCEHAEQPSWLPRRPCWDLGVRTTASAHVSSSSPFRAFQFQFVSDDSKLDSPPSNLYVVKFLPVKHDKALNFLSVYDCLYFINRGVICIRKWSDLSLGLPCSVPQLEIFVISRNILLHGPIEISSRRSSIVTTNRRVFNFRFCYWFLTCGVDCQEEAESRSDLGVNSISIPWQHQLRVQWSRWYRKMKSRSKSANYWLVWMTSMEVLSWKWPRSPWMLMCLLLYSEPRFHIGDNR